jgi:hypothetical protein
MIYEKIDDIDSLVSLREAFLGMHDEDRINKRIKDVMTGILATATFCVFTTNPANIKTDVRVKLKERDDGDLRWVKSPETVSREFQTCDIKDIALYMLDGTEGKKERRRPSAHFLAAGRTIPGYESLGRLPPHHNIIAEESGITTVRIGLDNVSRDSFWANKLLREKIDVEFVWRETDGAAKAELTSVRISKNALYKSSSTPSIPL